MEYNLDRIEVNPAICHGKPVVRGTRILVSQVLGAFAAGDSTSDILEDYPVLTPADVSAVFAFAGSLADFEEVPYAPTAAAQ